MRHLAVLLWTTSKKFAGPKQGTFTFYTVMSFPLFIKSLESDFKEN